VSIFHCTKLNASWPVQNLFCWHYTRNKFNVTQRNTSHHNASQHITTHHNTSQRNATCKHLHLQLNVAHNNNAHGYLNACNVNTFENKHKFGKQEPTLRGPPFKTPFTAWNGYCTGIAHVTHNATHSILTHVLRPNSRTVFAQAETAPIISLQSFPTAASSVKDCLQQ